MNVTDRLDRRDFLGGVGAIALGLQAAGGAQSAAAADVKGAQLKTPSGKPLRGLWPIVETPFTPDDKLDADGLADKVRFINRGGCGGMIWPVFASAWSTLSDAERIEGAETMLAAGKGSKSAIAIAVQNNAWDVPTSVRYARHAAAHGADAIVAIPPNNGWNQTDQAIIDYYKTIGAATDLPLIVQTRGTMSVELMLEMFKQIPTMKATKDEVGNPSSAHRAAHQGHQRRAGGLGCRRRHGQPTAGNTPPGRGGPVPHPAVLGPLATGHGPVLGRQKARSLRHVRPRSGLCHHPGCDRIPDGGSRRVQGRDQAAATADGTRGASARRRRRAWRPGSRRRRAWRPRRRWPQSRAAQ